MISNLYPPYVHGGAELYVHHISQGLSRSHDISVITATPYERGALVASRRALEENCAIYRFFPLNLYSTFYYSRKPFAVRPLWHALDLWNPHTYAVTKKVLQYERPDIVHVHNFKGLSASVFAAAKDLDIPVVHTVHDYNLVCPKTTLLTRANEQCAYPHAACRLYRQLLRGIAPTAILVPSDFMVHTLAHFGLFVGVPTIKVPLGIGDDKPVERSDNGTLDILYVGRVERHKGVQSLLESMMSFAHERARLHVVGMGSDISGFQRAARHDSRIVFHGFVPRDALRQLYSIADVAVVPSIYNETFGLVIPEYYRHGIPVVGSRAGAIPELISEGYNGFLFEPGDATQLTAHLDKIARDPGLLKRLSVNARQSSAAFDMSAHVHKLEVIYEELLP
ncbi:MAG: glycosyltransferase family 4 protein [Halobacteriota archaeon]